MDGGSGNMNNIDLQRLCSIIKEVISQYNHYKFTLEDELDILKGIPSGITFGSNKPRQPMVDRLKPLGKQN